DRSAPRLRCRRRRAREPPPAKGRSVLRASTFRLGVLVRPPARAVRPSAVVGQPLLTALVRPGADAGARRAVRWRPDPPSGGRRARAPPAGSAPAARAAP